MSLNTSDQPKECHSVPIVPYVEQNATLLQVAGFCTVTWAFFWVWLELFRPIWYEKLRVDSRNRNYVVGLVIGLSFKILTIPSCALAAYMTPPEQDVAGLLSPMNHYQQTCWGSRGSTVFLELFHYVGNVELLLHHGLVLLAMSLVTFYNAPHRGLDLSLGALVSEWPSMTSSVITRLGLAGEYPTLDWYLLVWGAYLTLGIRVPALFMAMAMIPSSGLRGGPAIVVFIACLFYMVYNLNISWRRLKKANVWQSWKNKDGSWDFGVKIRKEFMISSASFFAGLETLVVHALVLAICSTFKIADRSRLICGAFATLPLLIVAILVLQADESFDHRVRIIMGYLAADRVPSLRKIGQWVVGGWLVYILILTRTGQTPDAHNKNADPRDIVASSPLFCELVLSWQYWVSATVALIMPMVVIQLGRDLGASLEPVEQVEGMKEDVIIFTPEMQLRDLVAESVVNTSEIRLVG